MRQIKKTPEETKRILNKSKSDPLPNPVHKKNMHKIRSINDKVKISKPQKEKLTGKTQNFRKNEKHQKKIANPTDIHSVQSLYHQQTDKRQSQTKNKINPIRNVYFLPKQKNNISS